MIGSVLYFSLLHSLVCIWIPKADVKAAHPQDISLQKGVRSPGGWIPSGTKLQNENWIHTTLHPLSLGLVLITVHALSYSVNLYSKTGHETSNSVTINVTGKISSWHQCLSPFSHMFSSILVWLYLTQTLSYLIIINTCLRGFLENVWNHMVPVLQIS